MQSTADQAATIAQLTALLAGLGQAHQVRPAMAAAVYAGSKLAQGENAKAFNLRMTNVMRNVPQLAYPSDHGGGTATAGELALRGTLDDRPGSASVSYYLTALDDNLAADMQMKMGPGDNEDDKLNVAAHKIPDSAPPIWSAFTDASLPQLMQHVVRKSMESYSVGTVQRSISASALVAGEDTDLWMDARERQWKVVSDVLSLHEFLVQLEGLLPKEQALHPILLELQRRPASPADWMADTPDDQKSNVSKFKKKLKEGVQQLEKKMRSKTDNLSSRWWAQGEREVAKAEKICTIGGEDDGNCEMRNAIAVMAAQMQQLTQA